ncbi:hypothetical protein [Chelatococcus sp. HY11]|uniref:hypothetical protein n=1 Tax=Chelatococcus sp. HY11 TaxID=2835634 RepID=UPI001BCAB544|nr:hypothetical protein [Chelatococcus sp. HY11]MBS7743532.1 hypothetical protein [Chelatococcus sp. HY11]CAH1664304.1 hypothetical protein CHELA20_40327 [Hyphomicrobiales bacterium]CAH1688208.1 hypothetical protein CHELA41_40185 [Hyphomicrobiales bacterium]
MTELLASAPTLDALLQGINFYYPSLKVTLEQTAPDEWRVVDPNSGKIIEAVRVRRQRGRFRFEAVSR